MQSVSRWSEAVSAGLAFVAMFDLRLPIILALVSKLILLFVFVCAPPVHSRRVSITTTAVKTVKLAVIKTLYADSANDPAACNLLTLFFYAACQSMIN